MPNDFPGNSDKQRAEEEKKLPPKPVLQGEVTVEKPSPFMVFYKAVFAGTVSDIKRNLFARLVNVTRDTIYNTFVGFLDDYIYGSGSSERKSGRLTSSSSDRDRYWKNPADDRRRDDRAYAQAFDVPAVIFDHRSDAESVLQAMLAYFSDYGNVPVSLYLDYAGKKWEYTDSDWGWRSMDGVTVKPTQRGDGYVITLPRPEGLR